MFVDLREVCSHTAIQVFVLFIIQRTNLTKKYIYDWIQLNFTNACEINSNILTISNLLERSK